MRWIGIPLALMTLAGLGVFRMLHTRAATPGRIALAFLGAEIVVASLATLLVFVQLDTATETRCEPGAQLLDLVTLLAVWSAPALGGVAIAAIVADARRHGGVLYWHVPAAPFAVVLSGVVLFELLYLGLTCTS